VISKEASAAMFGALLRSELRSKLPRLLPDDLVIGNKSGELPGVENDVAVVRGNYGTWVCVVLTEGVQDVGVVRGRLAEIALACHEHFSAKAKAQRREARDER